MANTTRTYTGDGSRVLYPIDFELGYIKREYVYVYSGDDYTTQLSYTWQNANEIELDTPVASGETFTIRRVVPRDKLVNDYADNAILKEKNLDDSYLQPLMILEEIADGYLTLAGSNTLYGDIVLEGGVTITGDTAMQGNLDMLNNQITNLAAATNPTDAVTLQQVSELLFQTGVDGIVPVIAPKQLGDGVTTTFQTPAAGVVGANPASFFVHVAGVYYRPVSDYSINQGTGAITFLVAGVPTPPVSGAEIDITYFNPLAIDNPDNMLVTATGTTTPRSLADWTEKEILSYKSVAAAKADVLLEVGRRVETYGYYKAGDGGGAEYVVVAGGTGTDDGGSYHNCTNSLQLKLSEGVVDFRKFGAKGDFDPATGLGTDDRVAIQATIDYTISLGGGFISPPSVGAFYLGTNYTAAGNIAAQIMVGVQAVANSAIDVHIDTSGSRIYQGAAGRAIMFANANYCSWKGLHCVGFTGGTLNPGRENDAVLMINKRCKNIDISGHYLTNSLGDSIIVQAAVDEAGGGQDFECRDIFIHDGVMKERYGNNIPSHESGTRSREAVAIIAGINVQVYNNLIYGSVDLEPNLSGQRLHNCVIRDNVCSAGKVVPQDVIGTSYWHDEPLTTSGLGGVLNNDIKLQGVAGAPDLVGNSVKGNVIDNGRILTGRAYEFADISSNSFGEGSIVLGNDDNVGFAVNFNVHGNTCVNVFSGRAGFIELNGQVGGSHISDNFLTGNGICVSVGVATVGPAFDGGNTFSNNRANNGNHYAGEFTNSSIVLSNRPFQDAHFSQQVLITGFAGVSNVIDYREYRGENWWIQNASGGANTSIANITNLLGDGAKVTITSDAFGGGTLSIINGSGILLKGGVTAVMASGDSITLMRSAGTIRELSRSF